MAVSEAAMRKKVREVRKLQAPEAKRGVRWTPGLASAITKPRSGDISSSAKVRLHSIDLRTLAVWERDRITERGRLNSKMREGRLGRCVGSGCRPDQFPEPHDPRRRSRSPESVHIIPGFAFTMSIA